MLFNIKSPGDVRAALYALLPIIATLLVSYGVFTEEKASLWIGLATAILGPAIQAVQARTVSSFRSAFYAVLGAAQAVALGYGVIQDGQVETWLPLITALVGTVAAAPAVANTDTTPADGRS